MAEPNTIQPVLDFYANLMSELKVRLDALRDAPKLPVLPRLQLEAAQLQVRLICELIALSSLVVHGDMSVVQTKAIQKEWAPAEIIKALEKAHPAFYPHPTVQVKDAVGTVIDTKDYVGSYLTRDKLLKAWGRAGDVLHRGSLRNLKLTLQEPVSFSEAEVFARDVIALLSHHQIALFDPAQQVWVVMNTEGTGAVSAVLMQKVS